MIETSLVRRRRFIKGVLSSGCMGSIYAIVGGVLRPIRTVAQSRGGVLRVAVSRLPERPQVNEGRASTGWATFVRHFGLLVGDPILGDAPYGLAESYDISDDGRSLTISLRHGPRWHGSNVDLNAFDLAQQAAQTNSCCNANIDNDPDCNPPAKPACGSQNIPAPPLLVPFNGLNVLDDRTLTITFPFGFPAAVDRLRHPLHIAFDTTHGGTGPYRLEEYSPETSIIFRRNEEYWNDERGYFDEIRVFTRDGLSSLENGDIDVALELQPDELMELRQRSFPDVYSIEGPAEKPIMLYVNKAITTHPDHLRAVKLAIDRQSLSEYFFGGASLPGQYALVSPESAVVPDFESNPEAARDILAANPLAAGNFVMYASAEFTELASAIADTLRNVGIALELRFVETNELYRRYGRGEFDFMIDSADYEKEPFEFAWRFSMGGWETSHLNVVDPDSLDIIRDVLMKGASRIDGEATATLAQKIQQESNILDLVWRRPVILARDRVQNVKAFSGGVVDLSSAWME